MKKMIIAGANGFLGKYLAQWFHRAGWEVVGLNRHGGVTSEAKAVEWDGHSLGDWAAELDGADVLINLAGKSVNCRYNQKNKNLILRVVYEVREFSEMPFVSVKILPACG